MAAGYVWQYGTNVPTWDDWDMVPALAGEQPVTLDWLWSQHNEHRVPLPRLIMLAVLRPLGVIDFRGGMYYNVLTIAALSAVLIVLARRLRPEGRSRPVDALLPLVLMNWAQGLNLLWGWQVEFFTSTLLAGAMLALVSWSPRLTRARAVGACACLLLLGMCGAHGIVMLPPMAVYFVIVGISRWWGWRRDVAACEGPRDAALLICLAAVCVAVVGVYLVGWERVPFHPQSSGVRQHLATALKFLAMSFGPAVRSVPTIAMLGALVLSVATGLLLMITWIRRAEERDRAAGMFCFLGAMAGLALAIGMGRDGFEPRYITLSVPAAAATYLVWVAYSPGGPTVRHIVPRLLLLVSLTCLITNARAAIDYGRQLSGELRAFQEGLAAGRPPHQLIARHNWWLHPHEDVVMDYLPMLRQAGVKPYANYRDDPPLREVRLPLTPTSIRGGEWDATTRTLTVYRRQPAVNFELPEPLYIAGVRLKYRAANDPARLPYMPIYWREPGQVEIPRDQFHKYSPTGDRANWERGSYARLHDEATVVHAWLCRRIDAVRLEPEPAGGRFVIDELVLLVPVDGRPLP